MNIKTLKTHKITNQDQDILKIIDTYIDKVEENSILVVTSKIVSICEGRIVATDKANKDDLVKQESEFFLDKKENKYGFSLTITQNLLIPAAGIDESNGNGYYILWPKNPQETANKIREHISKKFKLKNFGVVITDSKTTPLRWGTTGVAIAHSGFYALNNYIGTKDLFGREMRVTQTNIMDGLAAAAVVVMGEGQEQTPLALIKDIESVKFNPNNPTKGELEHLHITLEEDIYASILKRAPWKPGDKK